ncbi:MAG: tetratricopeptide repeat protein [Capsulimonadaceae bacterium]
MSVGGFPLGLARWSGWIGALLALSVAASNMAACQTPRRSQAAATGGSTAQTTAPLLVLFSDPPDDSGAMKALSTLRTAVRDKGYFDVLTYDVDSPRIKRAAAENQHPEWTGPPIDKDSDRLDLARAVGAAFYAVVEAAGDDQQSDIRLVCANDPSHSWSLHGRPGDQAAVLQDKAESLDAPAGADSPAKPVTSDTAAAPAPVAAPDTDTVPAASNSAQPGAAGITSNSAQPGAGGMTSNPGPADTTADSTDSGQSAADEAALAQQLALVQPVIAKGDTAMDNGQIAQAIADYEDAINDAPLSAVPRLRLARAYLQGGFKDKAIDEAKRGLEVAPDSIPLQEFLIHLDTDDSTSEGTVAMYEALVEKNPKDLSAHLGLADAYWSSDLLARAEEEYKIAEHLGPSGDRRAATQLARLYAVQSKYDDALDVVKTLGAGGYPVAMQIVQARSETLIGTLTSARETFDAGKSSHEDFYDTAKKVSADAGGLSDFISAVTPPALFKVSYLHRQLSATLIAQEADMLQSFIETSDGNVEDSAAKIEKSAETEMLTAHAAEEKLGLNDHP